MLEAEYMRAAIYFSPAAGHELSRCAARWLGRDPWSGTDVPRREEEGHGTAADLADLDAITAEPRRYGFHATLKPPFRLAEGTTVDRLRGALAEFCVRPSILVPRLSLARLGSFFALVPAGDVPALSVLAADAVRAFDRFRAPSSEVEIARRRPERLTPRQRAYLADWGYPYVFDEFRFHMTLTGPVPPDRHDAVEGLLRSRFAGFIDAELRVDAVCLFVEPSPPGDFVVDTAVPLAGPPG